MGPAIIIAAAAATTGGIIAANQSHDHVQVHQVVSSPKIGGTLKNITSKKLVDNLITEIAIT